MESRSLRRGERQCLGQVRDREGTLRENRNAGARPSLSEFFADGRANISAGFEMCFAEDIIGKRTVNENLGAALDEGLDLGLPLLGTDMVGGGEHGEDFFGTAGFTQEFVKRAAGWNALAAFAGQDDRAALLHDPGGRAHAFHALVKIKIKRVTAVGSYHHVKGSFHLLHRGMADKFVTISMSFDQVARKNAGDLTLLVEADIQKKTWANPERDVPDFLPDRIADCDTEGGAGIADITRVVVAHHRFETGAAGHDSLRPTAEAGKEMRFDKACNDPDIRFRERLIDQRGCAAMGDAELLERRWILRFVVDDAVIVNDLGREKLLQFGLRIRTMGAELIQKGDSFARNEAEIFEQPRDEAMIRGSTGQVRESDADLLTRLDPVAQRLGPYRRAERTVDRAFLVRQRRIMRRFDHSGDFVWQIDREMALSIRELYLHRRSLKEPSA